MPRSYEEDTASKDKVRIPQSRLSRSVPSLHSLHSFGSRRLCDGPIILGVCAMEKKARAAPMREILDRISAFTFEGQVEFKVVIFPEETLLKRPIEEWPICEALIAFFSTGFPLRKAQAYASLRRPLVCNDLEKQEWLFDRRRVYSILESINVPVPKYVCFDAANTATQVMLRLQP